MQSGLTRGRCATYRPASFRGTATALGVLFALANVIGCTPATIIGPISHQEEERLHTIDRAKRAGVATDVIEKVIPPLSPDEERLERQQDASCQASYLWKNGLTYTGYGLVAAAAGITIGGAYATGNADETKAIFGVTGGTAGLLGTLLVAIGGIVQNNYTDRGCVTRLDTK